MNIEKWCHGGEEPYVNVQVEKEPIKKESIHYAKEVVVAELESLPSHKNQHKNEDSQVPEVTTLMVDKEESVASTAEHQPVQEQGSYPSVGQGCKEGPGIETWKLRFLLIDQALE